MDRFDEVLARAENHLGDEQKRHHLTPDHPDECVEEKTGNRDRFRRKDIVIDLRRWSFCKKYRVRRQEAVAFVGFWCILLVR